MVSRPRYIGGPGFGMKWDMGWMHDSLQYFSKDPIHRRYHHNKLTFRGLYMFNENFVLPLSHDEVAHGKNSLIYKMAGDEWQRFANLRLLYGYSFPHAGEKCPSWATSRTDQRAERRQQPAMGPVGMGAASGHQPWVSDLNRSHRSEPAFTSSTSIPTAGNGSTPTTPTTACSPTCAMPLLRSSGADRLQLDPCAATRLSRGRAPAGHWRETLNSNAAVDGRTDDGNDGGATSEPVKSTAIPSRCC